MSIPKQTRQRIIFLLGPTASGKTDTAVCLAKKIKGEIISCDSMQVYKGMDILTSKPKMNLRRKIPHHLIDIVSPEYEYNVSKYRQSAMIKVKEILKKGKVPIFVGGTGLYASVMLDGIFEVKAEDKLLRKRLYKEAQDRGSIYLYNRLKVIDPEAVLKIHPNDTRRIVRALEVFYLTGKPISYLQKQRVGLLKEYDVKIFCLDLKRDELYKRIEERIDRMFDDGLLDEVKKLLKLKLSRTANCAIGIKEIKGYLNGLYDLDEAKRLMKCNSRLYAKRQLTWFRKDKRINWIPVKVTDKPEDLAKKILAKWKEFY